MKYLSLFWLFHRKRKDKRENRREDHPFFTSCTRPFFWTPELCMESAWSLSFKSGIQALEVGLTARVFYGLMIDSSSGWMRKTAPFEEEHRAHNGLKSFMKYRSYFHRKASSFFFFQLRFYKRETSTNFFYIVDYPWFTRYISQSSYFPRRPQKLDEIVEVFL